MDAIKFWRAADRMLYTANSAATESSVATGRINLGVVLTKTWLLAKMERKTFATGEVLIVTISEMETAQIVTRASG
ncbi:MAG: hypothetical protein M3355_08755 [Actinomycetota bacterium]|nr:hypothetical protein [Actinomycetota bacterium]